MSSENITLRAGKYRAENTDSVWDAFDITMEVKETEKSYIFRLLDFKSRYAGAHIGMLFKQSARVVLRKDKGGHAVCKWSSEDFTFYPYQAGIPYYFKRIEEETEHE